MHILLIGCGVIAVLIIVHIVISKNALARLESELDRAAHEDAELVRECQAATEASIRRYLLGGAPDVPRPSLVNPPQQQQCGNP